MPGRHIAVHQMELYMRYRKKDRPALAGAKAGLSTATAYRTEADPGRPSEKRKGRGRRRPDPLAGIFAQEIVPLLEASPGLRAVVGGKQTRALMYLATDAGAKAWGWKQASDCGDPVHDLHLPHNVIPDAAVFRSGASGRLVPCKAS